MNPVTTPFSLRTRAVTDLKYATAKKEVLKYLNEWFGWKIDNIIDLGDTSAARGTGMMMPLWMRLFQGVVGHRHF
jgi:8-hydroxy-5-deazaflavin:NADPH oxidoreductase